jgi:predicted nucleotide-binding protein
MIWPASSEQQLLRELYAFNLSEDQLRERFIDPYDYGRSITWSGRTLPAGDISYLNVSETDAAFGDIAGHLEYEAFTSGRDVTNDWITGPPGAPADSGRVMVVHGRNLRARDAMVTFLRALGLSPIEWNQAVSATGSATPHTFEVVRAAVRLAQAVVVILTTEDQAGLLPSLADPGDPDVQLQGQPRQNVVIEAGLAFGVAPIRTILVQLGNIREASDFAGLNLVRLTNDAASRNALRSRLIDAGCAVDDTASDYLSSGAGGDFEACVVQWSPTTPP